jgi:hypothetical protein
MKTYVITLSRCFPAKHSKAGEPTQFRDAFYAGQVFNRGSECLYVRPKLHTIRANYPLWEKRIKEVQEGYAVLSIRQWTGKPYRSKQVEIATLTAENGVGLQRLEFTDCRLRFPYIDSEWTTMVLLAKNDGLSLNDWVEWFGGYNFSEPMAIIHFTKFRY